MKRFWLYRWWKQGIWAHFEGEWWPVKSGDDEGRWLIRPGYPVHATHRRVRCVEDYRYPPRA